MKKTKKNKLLNILSYVVVGIVFAISLAGIIVRFNKGVVYLFNTRADVVLSGSMSAKCEENKDFLDGHDDQYQKFDLVFSKKVNSDDELNVYDVVLYNNPYLGTTMHRIVGKTVSSSQIFTLREPTFTDFEGQKTIQLNNWASNLSTNQIRYKSFEVVLYSQYENVDHYSFSDGNTEFKKEVVTTKVGEYYEHRIANKDLDYSSKIFLLGHKNKVDYSKDYIVSVTVSTFSEEITARPNDFVANDEGKYQYIASIKYAYEIRGDNVADSDGNDFPISSIYSKVYFRIPGGGYVVRFITSIYGLILMIGIGFIIIGTQYLLERNNKKEQKEKQDENK